MDGKVVVVTGALGALGGVVAEVALSRGARVAGIDHAPSRIAASANRLELGGVDLTDPAQAKKAIDTVAAHFGRLDGLLNIAGGFAFETVAEGDTATWQRWQIEQLFRTLNRQGLNIESSQLEGAPGLTKLAVPALQVAVKSLQLTRARDGTDARLATDVFEPEELTVLTALQPKLEGKTAKQKNPHGQGQLAWAAWIIARSGGWKGYASESPPGPITMLRGMQQFASLRSGWALAEMCA